MVMAKVPPYRILIEHGGPAAGGPGQTEEASWRSISMAEFFRAMGR